MRHEKYNDLYAAIRDAGFQPYVIGGYVRDVLLGRQPKDVDIVVVGVNDPLDHGHLEKALGYPERVGKSFPVWLVGDVEVALARTEKKVGEGYQGFAVEVDGVTLEEDLRRRDLTINAMALDPFTGQVIDPFNGAKDLQNGVLRPVGPHFGEDPVRILRAARFAAQLNMTISDELVEAAQPALAELVDEPGERLWGELEKALRTQRPSLFLKGLDKLGALDIVLPEVAALKDRVQPEKYHPEGDAYVHTLLVVDEAAKLGGDDETMFAALVHDLGKAVTPDDDLPRHINHEQLGVPLVEKLCDRLRVPNQHRKVAILTTREHLNIHRFLDLRPVKQVRLIQRLNGLHEDRTITRVSLASMADAKGRGPILAAQPYPQRDAILEATKIIRGVNGNQYVHLKDGKKIAQKLEQERAKLLASRRS